MSNLQALADAVIKADIQTAVAETQKALDAKTSVQEILDQGLISSMDEVGSRFSQGSIFVPQMLRSAKAMQECMEVLKPHFQEQNVSFKGTILLGTVKGDLHDIGKNLVSMMLEGAGFTVIDLGVDVSPQAFVEEAKKNSPQVLAMSALLSTTMPAMRETIQALEAEGMRDQVRVIIGGAPVTENYAAEIKADGYAPDAGYSVGAVKKLLGIA